MPEYRRAYVPGGTYFLALVTYNRTPLFAKTENISRLRSALATVKSEMPFELEDAGWSLGFDVRVVPSLGRGFHNTVTTPNPLPDDLAEALSKAFRQMPNPSPF